MCGIAAILNVEPSQELRQKALKMSQKIRHRGPDWSGIYCGGSAILAHERLSIVDPESGGQPLFSPDQKQVLAVNGEIYNHQEIRRRYAGQYEFQTGSDCEVILALYREKGINFLEDLSVIRSNRLVLLRLSLLPKFHQTKFMRAPQQLSLPLRRQMVAPSCTR